VTCPCCRSAQVCSLFPACRSSASGLKLFLAVRRAYASSPRNEQLHCSLFAAWAPLAAEEQQLFASPEAATATGASGTDSNLPSTAESRMGERVAEAISFRTLRCVAVCVCSLRCRAGVRSGSRFYHTAAPLSSCSWEAVRVGCADETQWSGGGSSPC
jgi:hypothetical protein